MTTSLLFVCTGNICRSPLAEGLFLHHAKARGVADAFRVDSAGTGGWHAGERADARMRATAERHGVILESRARQLRPDDYETFDLILAADAGHHRDMIAAGADPARLAMMLTFHPEDSDAVPHDVPDPYYGGQDGFDTVYELVDAATAGLLDHLLAGRPTS